MNTARCGLLMRRFGGIGAVCLAAAGCATGARAPAPVADDRARLRAEVDSLSRAMVAAFDSSPALVARFYADSARIVGPRRNTVRGRQAIDRYWASVTQPAKWTLEVVEVGGSHDAVHQVGISSLTSTRRDGTSQSYVCDFVVLWRRQPDGSLRITLDLYN